MRRFSLACAVLLVTAAGCTREPEAPAPVSGLDLATFDTAVRPQDDLAGHVNGGWLAATEIPADRASYGAFNEVFDRTQEQLRVLVEEAAAPGGSAESRKIGDFYTAFMDETRVNTLGLAPLEPELAAIDALRTKTDLARHFARLAAISVDAPIIGFVESDARDPGTSVFYAFQGGLGLPDRDYYLEERFAAKRAAYQTYAADLLRLAGWPEPETA
ncbi:MAG: hypothetical protein ACLGHP_01125, partial [Vicinamibacteria bacterium]